jgi:hypothetical protein
MAYRRLIRWQSLPALVDRALNVADRTTIFDRIHLNAMTRGRGRRVLLYSCWEVG